VLDVSFRRGILSGGGLFVPPSIASNLLRFRILFRDFATWHYHQFIIFGNFVRKFYFA